MFIIKEIPNERKWNQMKMRMFKEAKEEHHKW